MSSLKRKSTIVANEEVEKVLGNMESIPEQKYEAQHPALAYLQQKSIETEPDHLENYIEVNPYN